MPLKVLSVWSRCSAVFCHFVCSRCLLTCRFCAVPTLLFIFSSINYVSWVKFPTSGTWVSPTLRDCLWNLLPFPSFDHLFPSRHISDLIPSMRNGLISSLFPFLLVPLLPTPSLAPVPRCGPLIIINKVNLPNDKVLRNRLFQVPESLSLISDLNPFFPVPPCEYGGPLQALR